MKEVMSEPGFWQSRWGISLLASLGMGVVMLAVRIVAAAPLPPEMLFNFTARLLGVPWVFNLVHELPLGLDQYAKYALFILTFLAFLGSWVLLGWLLDPLLRRSNRLAATLLCIGVSVASVGLVFLPLQGLGAFGAAPANFFYPPLTTHLWAAAFGLVFAVIHILMNRRRQTDPLRREALGSLARLLGLVAASSILGRIVAGTYAAAQGLVGFFGKITGLSPEILSAGDHYVVSKNIFNPTVAEKGWQLRITGLVDNELTLTLDDLKALPAVERSSTLTCISNKVGGDLIGNSVWTGVHLSYLLEMAGVKDGASELILRAADNYSDSFPLMAGLRDATIVAYLQNGEPLTRDHGFPARVLVPGIYGMKNVKWVAEIELADSDYQGYWQVRGWSDSAIVRTMSRIDTARATRLEDGNVAIGGIAFAGLRGVQRVEVSVDGGESWQEAELKPALNELSWNLWGFSWQAEPGTHDVLVRATDGSGEVQTKKRARPLPDGATGYHLLRVNVS